MKHGYKPSFTEARCLLCQYDEISHTDKATCEACGLEGDCDFYPDEKHPRKMLLCLTCYERERKAQAMYSGPKLVERDTVTSAYQIRTAGEYFNANIPAIMDIRKAIEADETIENKRYEEAKQVKDRVEHLSKALFEMDKQRATIANEQRETLVYFNHLMKDLTLEKQVELGLVDITYKQEKAPKKITAPSIKKFDKSELKKVATENNIPEYMLQGIVTGRKVSVLEAVKIYNEINAKIAK